VGYLCALFDRSRRFDAARIDLGGVVGFGYNSSNDSINLSVKYYFCDLTRPAARVSLVDSVADILRERIRSGLWRVRDKLPIEPELAVLLGVSRGTVRVAVRSLVVAGLLDVRQGVVPFWHQPRSVQQK
jgi:hypothetical protein